MSLASCVKVVLFERNCVLQVCITQILSEGSLCGKSFVNVIVKILLCEGGDIELSARTSKHIFMFAFDPLSLTLSLSLSLILCPALIHIAHIIYLLDIDCVCSYLCLTKRASNSTSTLI